MQNCKIKQKTKKAGEGGGEKEILNKLNMLVP